jgi:hypothetical protein
MSFTNFLQILAKQSTFVILFITFNKFHTSNSPNISLFQLNINFLLVLLLSNHF